MEKKFQYSGRLAFTKLFAASGSTARIAIIEKTANRESCITGDFAEMTEMSRFTVGQNVKQLARVGIINGSFTKKTMIYCID